MDNHSKTHKYIEWVFKVQQDCLSQQKGGTRYESTTIAQCTTPIGNEWRSSERSHDGGEQQSTVLMDY